MNNEGYEFYKVGNRSVLIVDTREIDIDKYVTYINVTGVNSVSVGYADDLNFLLLCKSIEFLDISSDYDFEPLYELKNLKSLMILNDSEEIAFKKKIKLNGKEKYKLHDLDVSRLDCIQLRTMYDENMKNLGKAKNLKSLELSKYKPQSKDLGEISELTNLDYLTLIQCNTTNLNGIQNLKNLKCLYLEYLRNLTDIDALEAVASTLTHLVILHSSKNIRDYSVFSKLKKLILLKIWGGGSIPNLKFIEELKDLKTFVFDFNVLDGDLTYCKELSYAGPMVDKRHYNLKWKDLPKEKLIRGDMDIEEWRRNPL